jgi:CHAD domain-containing protein
VARPRSIPDLSCEDSYAVAAAKVVSVRAGEVFEHAEGVLDLDDIERVHDMRVATRRLRASLEVFRPCFPKKRFKRVLKEVKQLADSLGERRDRDVAIATLEDFEAAMHAPDRPGLRSLIESLVREQRQANEMLEPAVSDERLLGLRTELDRLVREAAS